ncbi:MAG: DUF1599 domain-containing protein [Solirubrobacteraceae bacterium]|nr:DUF1599 domain-containing protein [Solirubrobacteraceae bacterium]
MTTEPDTPDTGAQYAAVIDHCRRLFETKLAQYGPAWRMFRLVSVVDQIYIKARRIRQIEGMSGAPRVADSIEDEYAGILNYAVMSIWHVETGDLDLPEDPDDLAFEPMWSDPVAAGRRFLEVTDRAAALLAAKNHDYGEAWRDMAMESLTDEVLSRTVRIKSLLATDLPDLRRVDSQLVDVINYAAFALVRLRD